jgi:flotillin
MAQAAKDQEVLAAQEHVAARRAELKERELDTEVRKPADAQRYAVEQGAAADKSREIAYAEAQAEQTRLSGAAERERRTALAEATRAEGLAEADAIAARGQAEAEAMQRKADAYSRYNDAAVVDIVAGALPKVVAEAAAPMGQIDQMTVISTDGASQTVKSVASTVAQSNEMLKTLFGVDLAALVQGFGAGNGNSATNGAASDTAGALDVPPPPPPPPADGA